MSIIVRAVEGELRGSGSIIGYRSMHQRLTTDHQLIVTRNIVRQVIKILDPEGVEARSRNRLRRQLTKELRLGGEFCENNVLTGGLSTLRI